MAYTNIWNETLPNGTEPANTIDDIFRSLKLDLDQRLSDIFGGIPSFATDPLRPYGLKLTDAQDATVKLGDAGAGVSRKLIFADKTGASQYASISSAGLIIGPTNGSGGVAGAIYKHPISGLVLEGITGGTFDLALVSPAGANVLSISTGTNNLVAAGRFDATGNVSGANISANGDVIINGGFLNFLGKSLFRSLVDGNFTLTNNAVTSFNLLQFGGTTASFPALKRSTTIIQARFADDSGFTAFQAAQLVTPDVSSTSSGVDLTIHNGGVLVATFSATSSLTTLTGQLSATGVVTNSLNFSNFVGQVKILSGTTGINFRNNTDSLTIFSTDNSGNIASAGQLIVGNGFNIGWSGAAEMRSSVDGKIVLLNNAATDFSLLQLGGTTASFPSIKRSLANVLIRLADDSAYTGIVADTFIAAGANVNVLNGSNVTGSIRIIGGTTGVSIRNNANTSDSLLIDSAGNVTAGAQLIATTNIAAGSTGSIAWSARSGITSPADSKLLLTNNAGTSFNLLQFGGTTASFPAIKTTSSSIQIRLADDSAYTGIFAKSITLDSTVTQFTSIANRVTGIAAATTIINGLTGGWAIVAGSDGVNNFRDMIVFGPVGVTVQSSNTIVGAPAVRTYSISGSTVKLAMASGTYSVDILIIQ